MDQLVCIEFLAGVFITIKGLKVLNIRTWRFLASLWKGDLHRCETLIDALLLDMYEHSLLPYSAWSLNRSFASWWKVWVIAFLLRFIQFVYINHHHHSVTSSGSEGHGPASSTLSCLALLFLSRSSLARIASILHLSTVALNDGWCHTNAIVRTGKKFQRPPGANGKDEALCDWSEQKDLTAWIVTIECYCRSLWGLTDLEACLIIRHLDLEALGNFLHLTSPLDGFRFSALYPISWFYRAFAKLVRCM